MGSHPTKVSAQRIAQEAKTEERRFVRVDESPSTGAFFLPFAGLQFLFFLKSHVEEYWNTQQKWKRKKKQIHLQFHLQSHPIFNF